MEFWEIEAREQIRDLIARYNANGDSGRIEQMMELFCEQAVMEVEKREHRGLEAIRSLFSAVAVETREKKSAHFIRHFTATHQIDIISDREAKGRCYFQTLTERGLDHWGRYLDDYRRVGERWLFWQRRVTVDGRVEGGWSERVDPDRGQG